MGKPPERSGLHNELVPQQEVEETAPETEKIDVQAELDKLAGK